MSSTMEEKFVRPVILCVIGESGGGKTSAVEFASKALGIPIIRSYTTRPMREGETDGVEHIFVSDKDMPDKSEMIAYTYFGGYHYWATKAQVKSVCFYVIDEVGLIDLVKRFSDTYYIMAYKVERPHNPTDEERKQRDRDRLNISNLYFDEVFVNETSLPRFLFKFTCSMERHIKRPCGLSYYDEMKFCTNRLRIRLKGYENDTLIKQQ